MEWKWRYVLKWIDIVNVELPIFGIVKCSARYKDNVIWNGYCFYKIETFREQYCIIQELIFCRKLRELKRTIPTEDFNYYYTYHTYMYGSVSPYILCSIIFYLPKRKSFMNDVYPLVPPASHKNSHSRTQHRLRTSH